MSNNKPNHAFPLIFIGSGLILLAVAGVFFVNGRSSLAESAAADSASAIPAQVDFPAPELILVDLSGEPVSLADYQDKVVLVNNWATWCPPCKAEMPDLEAYYQAHADEAFVLVGISAGDTAQQVASFIQEFGTSFPMWLDPDNAALRAFRNDALPSSYVIDTTGTVRLAWSGAISLEMLEQHVTPLIRE
jgi:cytochrome c biogenesis protein CcmG, thiol:disulfide interchange protein DsbE